ncbi:MAG: hypothetical protein Q7S60_02750 [bacterium]|nr:hypothetical protein [bacterium]
MDKENLLQQIRLLASQNLITRDEIVSAYGEGVSTNTKINRPLARHIDFTQVFYYIGGAIIFLGLAILTIQNWTVLNTVTKILLTLGSGISVYILGVVFGRYEGTRTAGTVFYSLSALLIPVGLYVLFDAMGLDVFTAGFQTFLSFTLLAVYALSFLILQKDIFLALVILLGTWFFFALTDFIVGGNPYFLEHKFFEYRALLTGLTYLSLASFFARTNRDSFIRPLYGLGILLVLGAGLALGGWSPNQNFFWELIFPFMTFGVMLVSVKIKRQSFLVFGIIFLMAYILKITAEYFSVGLGWPISLVTAGFMLMGVGYLGVRVNKTYIARKPIQTLDSQPEMPHQPLHDQKAPLSSGGDTLIYGKSDEEPESNA